MNARLPVILATFGFLVALGAVLWLGLPEASEPISENRLVVVTTVYPLADFAQKIGGEFVYVNNVVAAGAEPHEFEPTPRVLKQVLGADVLIYVGGGLDAWAEDMAGEVEAAGGQVLGMEDVIEFAQVVEDEHVDEAEGDDHSHEGVDPHIWLDPVLAQDMVKALLAVLIQSDPEHADQYTVNADRLLLELKELNSDYVESLAKCELNDIIVSHDAFGYLGRRYGFKIHAISGLAPEAEPSANRLAELADEAEDLGIKTIFFETLVSPKFAETLAQEVGATAAVLNPLEGLTVEELQAGDDYLSVMQKNREALSSAMLCR